MLALLKYSNYVFIKQKKSATLHSYASIKLDHKADKYTIEICVLNISIFNLVN